MFRHIRFRLPSWFPRRTLAALLLGCLAAAGCASRDEVFQAGTQQLADGDYEAAIVQFNAAIEKNPRNAEAHFRRAQAEDALGRLDAALNDYRQAVALHDEIVRAQGSADVQRRAEYADAVRLENNPYLVGGYEIAVLERMAAAHFKAGEYARAIDDYSAAIRAGSRHAGVYRERGRAYLECELADLAAIDLESAVRLAPSDADTLCLLADASLRSGYWARAVEVARQAVRSHPNNARAQHVLGIALLASPAPDYATAFALLDAAQQADAALTPADPSLVARGHYGWGLALFGQGKEAEAVRQFQRAAQMDPNYGMLACTQVIGRGGLRQMTMSQLADLTPGAAKLHAAGLQSWSSGDLAGAIASLSEAIRLNPAVAVFHLDRGCAFLAQGSPDAAIADLNEAVRLKPDYAQAYYERGRARAYREAWHASAQDFTEAIRYPDELKKAKAAPLGELLACAYFNRGVAQLAEKKFDGAVRDFEVAEQRDPTLAAQVGPMAAEAHLGRGVEHLRASRWDDAEKDLAQAERLAPGLARDVQQHRGELHRRRGLERAARGEPHRALDDLRQAVAVDDRAANHEALGQTYLKACNWEKAVEHLKTAKDRDDSLLSETRPRMAEAYYGQAGDLERAGRRGEAIAKLSVAIELSPMTARYRRARGLLNYGSEAWPAAVADLRRAIVLGPELREELDPLLKQAERRRDEAR